MNAAYEQLIQHLDERDISYRTNGEHRSISAEFQCDVGSYNVTAVVDEEDCLFQVFGYFPLRVPEGARPMIAETVARANYRLRVGKFELDMDEGDLRFQAAQILSGDVLDVDVIDRLMVAAMGTLDIYLPAVLSVIYGNELPKDAIRCVEVRLGGGSESEA